MRHPPIPTSIPTTYACPRHGEYAQAVTGKLWPEPTECPDCVSDERIAARAWDEQRGLWQRWGAVDLPHRFRARRFENFKPRTAALKAVAAAMRRFADGQSGRPAIALLGAVGLGKTHLIASAAAVLVRRGAWVRYVTAAELLRRLRATFDRSAEETEKAVLEELDEFDVLIVDELGATTGTAWEAATLGSIVDARYADQRGLVLAGNIGANDLAAFIGERAADRLTEFANVLTVAGKSYRADAASDPALTSAVDDIRPPAEVLEVEVTSHGMTRKREVRRLRSARLAI